MVDFDEAGGSIVEYGASAVLVVGPFLSEGMRETAADRRLVVIDVDLVARVEFIGGDGTFTVGVSPLMRSASGFATGTGRVASETLGKGAGSYTGMACWKAGIEVLAAAVKLTVDRARAVEGL